MGSLSPQRVVHVEVVTCLCHKDRGLIKEVSPMGCWTPESVYRANGKVRGKKNVYEYYVT